MVDNGTVSYSNPVRQSLFNFTDCHKPKAETAAQRMRDINPGAVRLLAVLKLTVFGIILKECFRSCN